MQVKYKDGKKFSYGTGGKDTHAKWSDGRVWDKSVSIAADITKIQLLVRIRVELQLSYFTKHDHYELVRKIMGPEIFFEHKKERTFMRDKERDVVFQELLGNFKKDSLLTFPNPHFPAASLSPNIGISKKTAANTVHLSGRTIPDSPAGKSPAIAETSF